VLQFRPGYVSPDVWIPDEIFAFAPGEAATKTTAVLDSGFYFLDPTGERDVEDLRAEGTQEVE
jgi:hypothetical protein